MAKLTIRTIEIDLDDGTLPEVSRSIVSAALNGHAHATLTTTAMPLKLPAPSVQSYEVPEPKPAKVKRPYKRRAKAEAVTAPAIKPARAGSIIERIEQCLERYGWLSVSAISQKTQLEPKQVSMAMYHNLRSGSPRFKFDESDGTYNLADPPAI